MMRNPDYGEFFSSIFLGFIHAIESACLLLSEDVRGRQCPDETLRRGWCDGFADLQVS